MIAQRYYDEEYNSSSDLRYGQDVEKTGTFNLPFSGQANVNDIEMQVMEFDDHQLNHIYEDPDTIRRAYGVQSFRSNIQETTNDQINPGTYRTYRQMSNQ